LVTDKDNAEVEGLPDHVCREAWDVSSDGLIFFDTSGRVRAFDRKFTDITLTPVTDSEVEAMLPAGCRPLELLDAANPAVIRSCELTLRDGRRLPVRLKCARVRDGMLMAVCVEPARAATEDRTEWFDALLNVTDAVIVVLDREGRFVRFNRAAEALTGYSAGEAIGQDIFKLVIFEEDVEALCSTIARFLARPEGVLRIEHRWRMRDGSARTMSCCIAVIRGRAGDVEYQVATAMDITAIRKTERALASLSAEFLEAQAAGRHDICSYLHDTISQNLLVLALLLGDLNLQPDPDTAANIEQAFCLLNRCCQDLRVVTYALAPPVFEDLNPTAAFDWYSRHMRDDARVDVEFRTCAIPPETSAEVRTLLLAFIQEWAQKAIRYPGAAKTFISLKSTPLDNGMAELRLEVVCSDAENEAVKAVLASPAIRDRVEMLGGRSEVVRETDGIRAHISVNSGGERA
jgi:PAS domain S-box-containing protein